MTKHVIRISILSLLVLCLFASVYILSEIPFTIEEQKSVAKLSPKTYAEFVDVIDRYMKLRDDRSRYGKDRIKAKEFMPFDLDEFHYVDGNKPKDVEYYVYIQVYPTSADYWFGMGILHPRFAYYVFSKDDRLVGWSKSDD